MTSIERSGQSHGASSAANYATANTLKAGFAEVLDIVNPLQQLPVVGQIYRAVTGDAISGSARLLGGALYGGLTGVAFAAGEIAARTALEQLTAEDAGGSGAAARLADGFTADATVAAAKPTPSRAAAPAEMTEADWYGAAIPTTRPNSSAVLLDEPGRKKRSAGADGGQPAMVVADGVVVVTSDGDAEDEASAA